MQACLSERRLSAIIKQYENLPAETTISEITELLPVYAPRFFEYIGQFGVHYEGLIQGSTAADLGSFLFRLDSCYDDETRGTRIRGIGMLDAVWVGLEYRDMPAFFAGMLLASVEDNFQSYELELMKVVPSNLDAVLQRVGEKAFSAPANEIYTDALGTEDAYQLWLKRAGLKDPGAHIRAVDEYKAREIAAEHNRRDAAYEQFRNGDIG